MHLSIVDNSLIWVRQVGRLRLLKPTTVRRSVGWYGGQLVQWQWQAHCFNSAGAWQYFDYTDKTACDSSEGDRCLNRQR
jgi:hypothetical protein